MVKRKGILFLPLLAVVGFLLLSGCVGNVEEPVFAQGIASMPTPTPTPSPEPDAQADPAVPTPTPTAIPPTLSRADAESAVLDAIADCTTNVTTSAEVTGVGGVMRLFFDSTFSQATRAWEIEVDTSDFAVTFGTWRVNEGGTLEAQPVDRVADRIANSGLQCAYPTVLLEADAAPPRFVTHSGVDGSIVDASLLIGSAELASLRVWSGIYDCSQDFPLLADFDAYQYVNQKWMVEGKGKSTQYGLWQVDAATGNVTPVDGHAQNVYDSCDATPIVLSAEQAQIRIWVATYDCHATPKPELADFIAQQESPHRWVVEGRQTVEGVGGAPDIERLLGLWQVETDSGAITGLDVFARNMRAQACFQQFM